MRTVNVLGESHKNLKVFCAQSALPATSGFLSATDSGIRRSCHTDTVRARRRHTPRTTQRRAWRVRAVAPRRRGSRLFLRRRRLCFGRLPSGPVGLEPSAVRRGRRGPRRAAPQSGGGWEAATGPGHHSHSCRRAEGLTCSRWRGWAWNSRSYPVPASAPSRISSFLPPVSSPFSSRFFSFSPLVARFPSLVEI